MAKNKNTTNQNPVKLTPAQEKALKILARQGYARRGAANLQGELHWKAADMLVELGYAKQTHHHRVEITPAGRAADATYGPRQPAERSAEADDPTRYALFVTPDGYTGWVTFLSTIEAMRGLKRKFPFKSFPTAVYTGEILTKDEMIARGFFTDDEEASDD